MAPTTRSRRKSDANATVPALAPLPSSPKTNGASHVRFGSDDEGDDEAMIVVRDGISNADKEVIAAGGAADDSVHHEVVSEREVHAKEEEEEEEEEGEEKEQGSDDDDDAPEAVTVSEAREMARKAEEDAKKAADAQRDAQRQKRKRRDAQLKEQKAQRKKQKVDVADEKKEPGKKAAKKDNDEEEDEDAESVTTAAADTALALRPTKKHTKSTLLPDSLLEEVATQALTRPSSPSDDDDEDEDEDEDEDMEDMSRALGPPTAGMLKRREHQRRKRQARRLRAKTQMRKGPLHVHVFHDESTSKKNLAPKANKRAVNMKESWLNRPQLGRKPIPRLGFVVKR